MKLFAKLFASLLILTLAIAPASAQFAGGGTGFRIGGGAWGQGDGRALPANTVLPVVSGVTAVGYVLTTTNGTWTASPTFTYQWKSNGTAIGGATSSSYTPVTGDAGTTISVTVTGTNSVGSVNATSVSVGPINPVSSQAATFLAKTSGLDNTHTNAYISLINGVVTDGVWTKLDVFHIYATQDSTTSKLNLVSTSYNGVYGPTPPTFAADRGYTGVTASTLVFIDTGYTPTTSPGAQFTLNSAHLSMWSLTAGVVSSDGVGVNDNSVIDPHYVTGDVLLASVNCHFGSMSVPNSDGTGFYIANRSGATAQQLYKNGASVASNSTVTTTLANRNMLTVGNNNAGAGYGWGGQEAAVTIGSSLSSTDASSLYNRLRTYMTAVGVP
jgi:hypothetical protein